MSASQVLLMRHAEKPDAARGIRGVNFEGRDDPAELSVSGWQRSGALLRLFSSQGVSRQLPEPRSIFAAASHVRSARPARTVQLLAQTLGVKLRVEFEGDDVAGQSAAAQDSDGVVLICWRHESIAAIARSLLGTQVQVPEWDPRRFDMTWLLTRSANGWTFEQRPQLLMPGDRPDLMI
jgi:hypothetical protein